MLQLARVLNDIHFARSNVLLTAELEAVMDEICQYYEKSIAAAKEVSQRSLLDLRRCFFVYSHLFIVYLLFVRSVLLLLFWGVIWPNVPTQSAYVVAEYLHAVERNGSNKRKVRK
jgi:hypothetical protein